MTGNRLSSRERRGLVILIIIILITAAFAIGIYLGSPAPEAKDLPHQQEDAVTIIQQDSYKEGKSDRQRKRGRRSGTGKRRSSGSGKGRSSSSTRSSAPLPPPRDLLSDTVESELNQPE